MLPSLSNGPVLYQPIMVWAVAELFLRTHGEDAAAFALGHLVTAAQQSNVEGVREMQRVIWALTEMTRGRAFGETEH